MGGHLSRWVGRGRPPPTTDPKRGAAPMSTCDRDSVPPKLVAPTRVGTATSFGRTSDAWGHDAGGVARAGRLTSEVSCSRHDLMSASVLIPVADADKGQASEQLVAIAVADQPDDRMYLLDVDHQSNTARRPRKFAIGALEGPRPKLGTKLPM